MSRRVLTSFKLFYCAVTTTRLNVIIWILAVWKSVTFLFSGLSQTPKLQMTAYWGHVTDKLWAEKQDPFLSFLTHAQHTTSQSCPSRRHNHSLLSSPSIVSMLLGWVYDASFTCPRSSSPLAMNLLPTKIAPHQKRKIFLKAKDTERSQFLFSFYHADQLLLRLWKISSKLSEIGEIRVS